MLTHRLDGRAPTRQFLASLNGWFRCACDNRLSLVLVQTVDDVPLIREVLAPTPVALCPFGYDPDLFDPDLPALERVTDVGCYLTLRDDPRRVQLVETAEAICRRRGWTFRFQEGKYWHDYTTAIRTSRICLHRSDQSEVPFRMVETTILGAVFLTDPLHYHAETFFELGSEYLTYQPDLSDLERVLEALLTSERRLQTIAQAAHRRGVRRAGPPTTTRQRGEAPLSLRQSIPRSTWNRRQLPFFSITMCCQPARHARPTRATSRPIGCTRMWKPC
jgi:hypothetical protein